MDKVKLNPYLPVNHQDIDNYEELEEAEDHQLSICRKEHNHVWATRKECI